VLLRVFIIDYMTLKNLSS